MKSILIIGLGRFGKHMALKLAELKNQVMAVDIDEEKVNEVLPYITDAQIGDSTKENFIKSLGVNTFDICVVAIGNNFQSSLETTSLLKDLGAEFVLSRATRDVHAKFLLRNGADQVVYAEKEMAIKSAVRLSSKNIMDYIEVSDDYSIYEIGVPRSWVGKSIMQLNVRSKYHITILATKENQQIFALPQADYCFNGGETLLVLGHNKDMKSWINK